MNRVDVGQDSLTSRESIMKLVKVCGLAAVVCVFAGLGRGQEDKVDYAKAIVGNWKVSKADEGTVPVGTLIQFTKDGKMKAKGKKDDMPLDIEGTYTVKDNTFTMTLKFGDKESKQTITITKMTKTAMSTKDEGGKVVELERQEGKKKKDKK
jgi:uncharacterized protein (TIGR03066 family)